MYKEDIFQPKKSRKLYKNSLNFGRRPPKSMQRIQKDCEVPKRYHLSKNRSAVDINKSRKSQIFIQRCRSFGSVLMLTKNEPKNYPDISNGLQYDDSDDDSLESLDEWDLRVMENYVPTDATLPRKHINRQRPLSNN